MGEEVAVQTPLHSGTGTTSSVFDATSLLRRDWHEMFTGGAWWIVGLALGVVAMCIMLALALTSRDAAVKRIGGRRWKRLHRWTYPLLAVVLLHAAFNGADFGLAHAPDVTAPPDAGAFAGFAAVTFLWLALFLWRWRIHRRRMSG